MMSHYLRNPFFSLMLVLLFLTSCNGQNQTQQQQIISEPKAITTGQPKLVKTQGSKIDDEVRCALKDEKNNLWFGTTGEGVYRYDGKLFTQFTIKDGLSNNTIWSILEDKAGNIWFGTDSGICLYDGKGIMRYDGKDFTKFGVGGNLAISAFIDKVGNIWFSGGENDNGYGGDSGIWRYNGKSFTNFTTKDGLGDYSVWCFLEDKDGNIWVGTRNTGLYRYDGKNFTSFSE
jgi:ligand-binding sensor domain-containing protein